MDHPVNTFDVIRNYLAADEAKETLLSLGKKIDPIQHFKKTLSLFNKIKDNDLKKLVGDKERLDRFLNHSWFQQEIPLKYIGGWPQIGDLKEEWCQGSIVDVVNYISQNKDYNSLSIKKVDAMVPIINDILKLFPPILVQGGEIRHENELLFMPFDADDGSHRCIAAALSGKKTVKVYIGMT